MHDRIEYAERIEYGTLRRRILNDSDAVRAFKRLTGRTTLTDDDVRFLPHLGTRVVCVHGRIPTESEA